MPPVRALLAFAALALAGVASPAPAATFRYLSVEELASRSDACVLLRVVDAIAGWNVARDVIVTTFEVEVLDVLAGDLPPGRLTLTRVGGEVDGLALGHAGMPDLRPGQTAVAFVLLRAPRQVIVSGLAQGVLHERAGGFGRDLSEVEGALAREETLALPDLRARVETAWAAARAAAPPAAGPAGAAGASPANHP